MAREFALRREREPWSLIHTYSRQFDREPALPMQDTFQKQDDLLTLFLVILVYCVTFCRSRATRLINNFIGET